MRAHAHYRIIDFFAWTALPLNLKPQTRVGESRGLPGSLPGGHASISWGIKKINTFFFPCFNWVYSDHSETLVLKAGTCTRP